MPQKKILILNYDPILHHKEGGKQRTWHVREQLKSFGYQVIYKAYYDVKHFPTGAVEPGDVPVNGTENLRPEFLWQIDDYMIGVAILKDEAAMQLFSETILQIAPDIIILDYPWLWPPTCEFLRKTRFLCKIIYFSHNVEFLLKEQVVKEFLDNDFVTESLKKIKHQETELATYADLIITTSPADAQRYKELGANNVVSIENGTKKRVASYANLIKTKIKIKFKFKFKFNKKHFALYVSSGHPPNINGFCEYALHYARLLPTNSSVVVVGNCCDGIREILTKKLPQHLLEKFLFFGHVSDKYLASLYKLAKCIILPIREGSGSNIKTAEALVNGKRTLATNFAFRGFEGYIQDPDVIIADEHEVFSMHLKNILSDNNNLQYKKRNRSELVWQNRFTQIHNLIEAL